MNKYVVIWGGVLTLACGVTGLIAFKSLVTIEDSVTYTDVHKGLRNKVEILEDGLKSQHASLVECRKVIDNNVEKYYRYVEDTKDSMGRIEGERIKYEREIARLNRKLATKDDAMGRDKDRINALEKRIEQLLAELQNEVYNNTTEIIGDSND